MEQNPASFPGVMAVGVGDKVFVVEEDEGEVGFSGGILLFLRKRLNPAMAG